MPYGIVQIIRGSHSGEGSRQKRQETPSRRAATDAPEPSYDRRRCTGHDHRTCLVGEASPLYTSSKACKPRRFAYILTPPRALHRSSERRRLAEMPAISSTAARNDASFAFDGLLKALIFLTNWSDAARISSAVTGGSKLKRALMFRHIQL